MSWPADRKNGKRKDSAYRSRSVIQYNKNKAALLKE